MLAVAYSATLIALTLNLAQQPTAPAPGDRGPSAEILAIKGGALAPLDLQALAEADGKRVDWLRRDADWPLRLIAMVEPGVWDVESFHGDERVRVHGMARLDEHAAIDTPDSEVGGAWLAEQRGRLWERGRSWPSSIDGLPWTGHGGYRSADGFRPVIADVKLAVAEPDGTVGTRIDVADRFVARGWARPGSAFNRNAYRPALYDYVIDSSDPLGLVEEVIETTRTRTDPKDCAPDPLGLDAAAFETLCRTIHDALMVVRGDAARFTVATRLMTRDEAREEARHELRQSPFFARIVEMGWEETFIETQTSGFASYTWEQQEVSVRWDRFVDPLGHLDTRLLIHALAHEFAHAFQDLGFRRATGEAVDWMALQRYNGELETAIASEFLVQAHAEWLSKQLTGELGNPEPWYTSGFEPPSFDAVMRRQRIDGDTLLDLATRSGADRRRWGNLCAGKLTLQEYFLESSEIDTTESLVFELLWDDAETPLVRIRNVSTVDFRGLFFGVWWADVPIARLPFRGYGPPFRLRLEPGGEVVLRDPFRGSLKPEPDWHIVGLYEPTWQPLD